MEKTAPARAQQDKASTTRESEHGSKAVSVLAVLLATACWGASGVFVKLVAQTAEISALALAFWRDLTSFTVLLLILGLLRPDWLRIDRRADLKWLVATGAVLGTFHVFWNLGVMVNGAAVATVQQAAMPAIVTLVAWVFWSEPLTGKKILAIILTFVGTVLVSGIDVLGQTNLTWSGFLIGLGIPISYSGWNLLGKRARGKYRSLTVMLYSFGFGALVLFPLQLFTPQPWPVTGQAVLWFAALICIATVTPFVVYTFALGGLQASVATILAMTEIPIVAVYAYFILGERLTPDQFLGAALVVAGVLMLTWPGRKRPT